MAVCNNFRRCKRRDSSDLWYHVEPPPPPTSPRRSTWSPSPAHCVPLQSLCSSPVVSLLSAVLIRRCIGSSGTAGELSDFAVYFSSFLYRKNNSKLGNDYGQPLLLYTCPLVCISPGSVHCMEDKYSTRFHCFVFFLSVYLHRVDSMLLSFLLLLLSLFLLTECGETFWHGGKYCSQRFRDFLLQCH